MGASMYAQNRQTQNLFIGKRFFQPFTYTNSTGSPVTITKGTLIGQILITGLVLPQASGATDGSEMPIGVAAETYTVANGATITLSVCTEGDINAGMLILNGSDTLNTPVRTVSTGGGTIGALITRNTLLVLVPTTELGNYDN